jgi:hypothetical protein
METTHSEKRRGGVLVSRIASYPGANHVAPPAAKDEKEYRTRSPPRRNRRFDFLFIK